MTVPTNSYKLIICYTWNFYITNSFKSITHFSIYILPTFKIITYVTSFPSGIWSIEFRFLFLFIKLELVKYLKRSNKE